MNRKRVQRLWREEGPRVPQKARKRRRLGITTDSSARLLSAAAVGDVWAIDFQFDQTACGRPLKLLNIVDEFSREALAIRVSRRIDADAPVSVLDQLVHTHGRPAHRAGRVILDSSLGDDSAPRWQLEEEYQGCREDRDVTIRRRSR